MLYEVITGRVGKSILDHGGRLTIGRAFGAATRHPVDCPAFRAGRAMTSIITFNANGIRSAARKGFFDSYNFV